MTGRVLIIAGSDSGGGAGIQADIKTVTIMGGYAATAVTAITVQNTLGVSDIHPIPTSIIRGQIRAVLDDLGADAIKIGMLGTAEIITGVAEDLRSVDIPIVLDPVMVAKGGSALLDPDAIESLKRQLLPMAAVLTPNLPEAEALLNRSLTTKDDILTAGHDLLTLGPKAVVMKGGHGTGNTVQDWLITRQGNTVVEHPRLYTRHTHGTGCTFAAALATGLARGATLADSLNQAAAFVHQAIRHAPGLGAGPGPLGHNWSLVDPAATATD